MACTSDRKTAFQWTEKNACNHLFKNFKVSKIPSATNTGKTLIIAQRKRGSHENNKETLTDMSPFCFQEKWFLKKDDLIWQKVFLILHAEWKHKFQAFETKLNQTIFYQLQIFAFEISYRQRSINLTKNSMKDFNQEGC